MRISSRFLHIQLVSLTFLLSGCQPKDRSDRVEAIEPPKQSTVADSTFVGSNACKSCHQSICEAYSHHPMCLSTRKVEEDQWHDLPHNTPSTVSGLLRNLHVTEVGETMVHSEQMFDSSGILIYDQPHVMKYVIGSGTRARAYLEQRSQKLFMSPLNWYRKSLNWGLAPNYRPDDVRRFDRVATDECLNCHTGRTERKTSQVGVAFQTVAEASIGCERCHGPGSSHISFHESGRKMASPDPIKNPADFGNQERDELCYQCHLAASARVLHPGKKATDYQPGMKLSDVWAILDLGTDISKGQRTRSVNHVQQMRDSVCFSKSDGQLRCTSCHDPHATIQKNQAIEYYRSKCQQCHTPDSCTASPEAIQNRSNDCIDCHMSKLESNNIAHVAQSDHRILRKPIEESQTDDSVLQLFAASPIQLPRNLRQRGLALGTFIHCMRKGIELPNGLKEFMEKSLVDFPQDVLLLTSLGTIERIKQNTQVARNYFEKALSISPDDEAALDGLLEIAYSQRDWETCLHCTNKQLQSDPTNVRAFAIRGDARFQLGKVADGILDIEQAANLNPGELSFRQWLVEKYNQIHDDQSAKSHEKILERLQSVSPRHK
ncbi:MAG: multiheme c-type cytochrome [Pirellulales bacterium]